MLYHKKENSQLRCILLSREFIVLLYFSKTKRLPMIGKCLAFPPKPLTIPNIASTKMPILKIGNRIQPIIGIMANTILPKMASKKSNSPWFAWNFAYPDSGHAINGRKKIKYAKPAIVLFCSMS